MTTQRATPSTYLVVTREEIEQLVCKRYSSGVNVTRSYKANPKAYAIALSAGCELNVRNNYFTCSKFLHYKRESEEAEYEAREEAEAEVET